MTAARAKRIHTVTIKLYKLQLPALYCRTDIYKYTNFSKK